MNPSQLRPALFAFFLAALLISCSTNEKSKITLILTNGHIWTGADSTDFVEAIAISDNKIVQIGSSETINAIASSATKIIDLNGRLVTAGFNDAHIHFLSGSLGLTQVELSGTESIEDVILKTEKFIQENPNKEWITGRGWQYTFFESGLPDHGTMKFLDIDKPVFLRAYDGHSAYANRKALSLAGINSSTVYDGFGEVVKDKNGEPTGTLKESAMSLVDEFVPPPTYEEKLNSLRKGLQLANSLGITSVQNANGNETDLALFEDLFNKNELTVRYSAAFSVDENTTTKNIERYTFLKDSVGFENDFLRADAIKFMIDGVIESHSGAMLNNYADLPANSPDAVGSLTMPVSRYQELLKTLDQKGFRIYTHAIGDRGVREALNAYALAQNENKSTGRRHRVEHIETISPEDVSRFSKLDVMASMEPNHAQPSPGESVWEKAIGPQRLPYSFAWNTLTQHGAHLVFSSDWPAAFSLDPIRGLHVAVTRTNPSGFPEGGWIPEQRITLAQALKAYTYSGAYSSFEENKKGLIAPGYLADLVVYSDDLFFIPPSQINETKIVLTIFNGKIIYNKLD